MSQKLLLSFLAVMSILPCSAQPPTAAGPYKVLQTVRVGGDGGYDYVYADAGGRKLYIPRMGAAGRIAVFDLDTLAPTGEIAKTNAHGVAVDAASLHGFASSKPVAMWDAKTLAPIKTIAVEGEPDGIFDDAYNGRVYILSHEAPNATVIDAKDGSVLGTIDLGGEPEQAVSDGKGTLYIDLEDKGSIAVVDAKTLKVKGNYDLQGKGAGCAGLAMDVKNGILFAACRKPQTMVALSAADGKILQTLPIGSGTDGAIFNPKTMEAFATLGEGTLAVVKENSPTSFALAQTLKTLPRARTIALDSKTGRIFTITAEFGPPPPPAPGEKWSRAPMIPGTFSILEIGK